MPCFHPLPAIKSKACNKYIVGREGETFEPYLNSYTGEYVEPIKIPCGKCVGCRLDYSRTWADRCVMESLSYDRDKSWFVTLTYSDEFLPHGEKQLPTLRPVDFQLFMKRFRIRMSRDFGQDNIRFFCAGEYGDQSARPHYHALIFNCSFPDLRVYSVNYSGDVLYNSDILESCWGFGYCVIGAFEWRTAAYTARYVMKKQKGKQADDFYNNLGIVPEFVRMSRRPGIGSDFFDAHYQDIYQSDRIILPPIDGKLKSVSPPKYFDRKFKDIDPLQFAKVHSWRERAAELRQQAISCKTDLDEAEYLHLQEKQCSDRAKSLIRNL